MQGETIYKGATRPAMLLGVPLVPLVILCGLTVLLALWGGILVSGWISFLVLLAVVPSFLWMRQVTRRDDQRFRQAFLALKLRQRCRNRVLWRSRSYAAHVYRGHQEHWHA